MTSHDRDRLWSLARGNLPAEEAARVQAHVRGCAECARTLANMEAGAAVLAMHAVPAPTAELWSRVDRGVLAGAERTLARRAKHVWLRWTWMGGIAALIAIAWFVVREQPRAPISQREAALRPEPSRVPAPARVQVPQVLAKVRIGSAEQALGRGDELHTPPGVEARVMLQSTQVLVLPGTRVAIAERSRLDLSRGAVVIDARDELVIRALEVDVIIAGSSCVVRLEERGLVHVAVRDGVVRVNAGGEERDLAAGRAVTLDGARWQPRSPSGVEQRVLARLFGKRAPVQPQPVTGASPASATAPGVEPAPEAPAPSVAPDAGAPAAETKPAAPRGAVRVIRNRLPFAVQPEALDKVLPQPGR